MVVEVEVVVEGEGQVRQRVQSIVGRCKGGAWAGGRQWCV